MEHVEFTYTAGMDREAVEERLRETETGVLSLADGDEAYAIPLAHHYEGGDSIVFRLGVGVDSEKVAFLESTERACYVVYGYGPEGGGWSVLARGEIHPLSAGDERFDVAEINRQFPVVPVFDEDVADLEVVLFELRVDAMTGRRSIEE